MSTNNLSLERDLAPALPLSTYSPITSSVAKRLVQLYCYRMHVASSVAALNLKVEARYTSIVIFRRYTCHYFNDLKGSKINSEDCGVDASDPSMDGIDYHHLGVIAAVSIFLGCKAEDDYRSLRNVINVTYRLGFHSINDNSVQNLSSFAINEVEEPMPLNEAYWKMKEEIITKEQEVLRVLRFDICIPQPHRAMLWFIRKLFDYVDTSQTPLKDEIIVREKIMCDAWTILNKIVFSESVLRFNCILLASASISLSLSYITASMIELNFVTEIRSKLQTLLGLLGSSNEEMRVVIDEMVEISKMLALAPRRFDVAANRKSHDSVT